MVSSRPLLFGAAGLFLAIDAWGHVTRAYVTNPYVDVITHILFGLWFAAYLLHSKYGLSRVSIVFLVLGAGLGWELIELLYDSSFAIPRGISPAQHGLSDTLSDIANNVLGSLLAFIIPVRKHRESLTLPL